MKKYRVKLNDDRIVGPLSESDIKSLLDSHKISSILSKRWMERAREL